MSPRKLRLLAECLELDFITTEDRKGWVSDLRGLPEIDDWNAERNVGQPNVEQATAIALDTLDLLADEWEKDIDVPFIAASLVNAAKSSSIAAMMRQCFIEGAYRASQVMIKTASFQSSSAASSDHEETNTDPKP